MPSVDIVSIHDLLLAASDFYSGGLQFKFWAEQQKS